MASEKPSPVADVKNEFYSRWIAGISAALFLVVTVGLTMIINGQGKMLDGLAAVVNVTMVQANELEHMKDDIAVLRDAMNSPSGKIMLIDSRVTRQWAVFSKHIDSHRDN